MLSLAFSHAHAQAVAEAADVAVSNFLGRDVLDLSGAWRLALENDHVYRAAISEQAASETERTQGWAGLLPHVQAGYHRSRVIGSATQPNILGQRLSSRLDYDSFNAYVQLQQPILNYERYADYRRGNARADMGNAVFLVELQNTGIRLAMAYFDALLAFDNRELRRSLTLSLQGQTAAIRARYRQHEATRIDVRETEARLAVAQADLIDANDQWSLALRKLEAVLGAAPTHLASVRDDFLLPPLVPETLDEWLGNALAQNAEVQSARQAVRVANTEVEVAKSRYMPTADLVVAYGRAKSENLSSLSQKTNTFSVGIQVSIPLFAGGYNRANVARARSEDMQRQHEFRATIERIMAEVTRQYASVRTGADHINALEAAVESGELSLHSARRGFEVGVSSNLDVLKVQDRLYQTKLELAQARLEYLLARLKLAAAAGELDAGEFDEISDNYLDKVIVVAGNQLHDALVFSSFK